MVSGVCLLAVLAAGSFPVRADVAPIAAPQPAAPAPMSGARLFLAPMDWNLDRYIADELRRQGLPVQLVSNPREADFVMTGQFSSLGSRLISPGHYIQVRLVAVRGGNQVWTAEANDYALFFARLRRHGPGRAARSIVNQMRRSLFASR